MTVLYVPYHIKMMGTPLPALVVPCLRWFIRTHLPNDGTASRTHRNRTSNHNYIHPWIAHILVWTHHHHRHHMLPHPCSLMSQTPPILHHSSATPLLCFCHRLHMWNYNRSSQPHPHPTYVRWYISSIPRYLSLWRIFIRSTTLGLFPSPSFSIIFASRQHHHLSLVIGQCTSRPIRLLTH